ncbi:MAG TPA: aminotransferase, partial [Alphaproteobacteria bacterium]|nr:aminotransferase [Alphaproteobacteria bacterium]
AIFDLIVSPTAHILPVREMTKLCKQQGAHVLIDAAHGPGQVPLDIQSLGADWVTGNLHKWLFCPRGTAFFWAGPQVRDLTAPLAV